MAVRKVPVADIRPNPWQARLEEDPEHVKEIAASILAQGLLQVPGGRPAKGGKVELAFGMTRLAAFKWLAQHKGLDGTKYDPADYELMPVDVRERSQREMFEQAVTENEARKALSPIERARAMKKYMVEFEADREQAGRLFGLQASSVSNVLALLDLTPKVAALVHKGDLAERTGRMFVHLSRLRPDLADRIADDVKRTGESDPDEIAGDIADAMATAGRLLMGPWDRDRVEGKWWKLDADLGRTAPTISLVSKALATIYPGGQVVCQPYQGAKAKPDRTAFKVSQAAKILWAEFMTSGTTAKELVELKGWPAEAVERVGHLVAPPTCTACEYRAVIQGRHYCAFRECFQGKREAFKAKELEKARKGLAWAPIYKGTDGRRVSPESLGWYDSDAKKLVDKAMKQAVREKHPDLRMRAVTPGFGERKDPVTGSAYAELVAVGGLAAALQEVVDAGKADAARGYGRYQPMTREEAAARDRRVEFNRRLADEACRHLAGLFGGIGGMLLEVVGRLCLGGRMPWAPGEDPHGEDDFAWQLLPEGEYENEEEPPAMTPAERADRTRAAMAERLARWVCDWTADPRQNAVGVTALAAPGGPLAGLVNMPATWADEILEAYDRGDQAEPEDEEAPPAPKEGE